MATSDPSFWPPNLALHAPTSPALHLRLYSLSHKHDMDDTTLPLDLTFSFPLPESRLLRPDGDCTAGLVGDRKSWLDGSGWRAEGPPLPYFNDLFWSTTCTFGYCLLSLGIRSFGAVLSYVRALPNWRPRGEKSSSSSSARPSVQTTNSYIL